MHALHARQIDWSDRRPKFTKKRTPKRQVLQRYSAWLSSEFIHLKTYLLTLLFSQQVFVWSRISCSFNFGSHFKNYTGRGQTMAPEDEIEPPAHHVLRIRALTSFQQSKIAPRSKDIFPRKHHFSRRASKTNRNTMSTNRAENPNAKSKRP